MAKSDETRKSNQRSWRAKRALEALTDFVSVDDGTDIAREGAIIAIWNLEREVYGEVRSHEDYELKWYMRAGLKARKMALT